MDGLIIKVKGNYATFRKPFTTTSTNSYSIIHPPAIKGLIGAIMGIDRSEIYSRTKDMQIGIEVCNPIKKSTQSSNLTRLDKSWGERFPSNIEFLRDVEYNIYLKWNQDEIDKLVNILKNRQFVYNPYLGNSQYNAKIELLEECTITKISECKTKSVIELEYANLDVIGDCLIIEKIPLSINFEREYDLFKKVCFSVGDSLDYTGDKAYKFGEHSVVLL